MDLFLNWGSIFLGMIFSIVGIHLVAKTMYGNYNRSRYLFDVLLAAGGLSAAIYFFIVGLRGIL